MARRTRRVAPPWVGREIGEAGGGQLGAAQHRVVRHRHEGAVVGVDEPVAGGGEKPLA